MDRSVKIGIVIVLVLGAAVWILTDKQGQSNNAPNGQTAGGSNPGDFRERMTQFREQHKFTRQLTMLASNIGRLERDGQHKLTAKQAQQLLAVLQPLRAQPKLTQDEAKETTRALQQVLTMDQRTEIGKMPEQRFDGGNRGAGGSGGAGSAGAPGMGGPGGSGGGAPRGQGGSRGDRPRFDPAAMKDFNPFNPQSGGMGGPRAAARWDEFFKALEAKAKK